MEAERKRAQLIKEKVDMDEEHDELLGELTAPSMATKRKFGEVSAHKWKSGDPRQLNGDLAIMKFIASNNYSFNVVETVGFRELIETLCPKLQIKSASTFSRYMIFRFHIIFRILTSIFEYVVNLRMFKQGHFRFQNISNTHGFFSNNNVYLQMLN